MPPPGADTVVIRYGDMSTKSDRVRNHMENRLIANLKALLARDGIDATIEQRRMRPLVHTAPDQVRATAETAAEAFGVVSTSPATVVDPDFESVVEALARAAKQCYDGGTFAVDARRTGDQPYTSVDVERGAGAAIGEILGAEVDLDDPDNTFSAECRPEEAYVYTETIDGPGGLPLGSQAPLVALISGGIDSPVAAYEAMRRGSPVVLLYVDLGQYGGPDHEARAAETVRTLARYAPNFDMALRRVPAGEDVAHLVESMDSGRMLSWRRFLYRVAEHVANQEGARGIVTGEALGQKSSQTAANFAVTSAATDLPVHRPLFELDKAEITDRAREIGTFRDSTIPAGCNRIVPEETETSGRLDQLAEVEPDDLFERARRAADDAERVDVERPR